MQRLTLSSRGLALFVLGIGLGLAGGLWWPAARPGSPLTAGLSGTWQEASAQFDARLRSRFPPGTSVEGLVTALAAEGFAPSWSEANGEGAAQRQEGDFVCNVVARVYWREGPNGAVAAVRGVYREEGCL